MGMNLHRLKWYVPVGKEEQELFSGVCLVDGKRCGGY